DLLKKSRVGLGGPLDDLARDLAKDVHPLQGVVRRASAGGTLRPELADGPGRSATSSELVCLALCLAADPTARRGGVGVLADEPLRRNPAALAAMIFLLGRRTRPVVGRRAPFATLADAGNNIHWLSPPDRRPPVLAEPEVRTIAATERALTL